MSSTSCFDFILQYILVYILNEIKIKNPPNPPLGRGFSAGASELAHTCTWLTHTRLPTWVYKPVTSPSGLGYVPFPFLLVSCKVKKWLGVVREVFDEPALEIDKPGEGLPSLLLVGCGHSVTPATLTRSILTWFLDMIRPRYSIHIFSVAGQGKVKGARVEHFTQGRW